MARWIPNPPETTCPHCARAVRWANVNPQIAVNVGLVATATCPSCRGVVMDLYLESEWYPVWPTGRRLPVAPEVPDDVKRDWDEAVAVSPISTRAAAALARRALQVTLRKKGFSAPKLVKEIDLATASPDTPTSLREKLHVVREIGNDAAHPNEDEAGALVDVSSDDVEFMFETLIEAFDVYFVRPERHRKLLEARKKGGA